MATLDMKLVALTPTVTSTQRDMNQIEKKVQPVVAQPAPTSVQGGMAVTMTRRGISVSNVYSGGAKGTLTLLAGAGVDMAASINSKDKGNSVLRQQLLSQDKLVVHSSRSLATLGEDVTLDPPTAVA